jgi:hypothetical protein
MTKESKANGRVADITIPQENQEVNRLSIQQFNKIPNLSGTL